MRARVFLRQNLFSLPGEAAHVPPGAAVLDGTLLRESEAGVAVRVTRWMDDRGRELAGAPRTLVVPATKLDHILLLEDGG